MSKKRLIIGVVLLMLVAMACVLYYQKPKINTDIATLKNITLNINKIACEDARWLLDTNVLMIQEIFEEFKIYDDAQLAETVRNASDEEREKFAAIIQSAPHQVKLNKWHNEVIAGISTYYKGSDSKTMEVQDQIGTEYLRIYQAAMLVNLGIVDAVEIKAALDEEYCQ